MALVGSVSLVGAADLLEKGPVSAAPSNTVCTSAEDFSTTGVFSMDAVGGYTKDAVTLSGVGGTDAFGHGDPLKPTAIVATISDNTNVMVLARYAVDRLRLYAGYEWMKSSAPSDVITSFTDISGNPVCLGCTALNGTTINNTAFNAKSKIGQLMWIGARYALTDSVDVAAAWYHYFQNNYSNGAANGFGVTCAAASSALGSCAGTQEVLSALIDWKFAPKWDTYIGTNYFTANGGVVNGFLARNNWTAMAGLRFRW
jgi:predicted porin